MKTVSLVVRAVADGKRVNLSPEQAEARNLSGAFYLRWSEGGKEKWVSVVKGASAARVWEGPGKAPYRAQGVGSEAKGGVRSFRLSNQESR
jgi:hypothetical protein